MRRELIDREIVQMRPIGNRHLGYVNAATRLFVEYFKGRAIVSVQNPLRLSNYTEPEPDIVLLKHRDDDYRDKRPMAADALLVVEVADTTLEYDRKVKAPRHAQSGVPEYWIEDLENNLLLVFRNPANSGYQAALSLQLDDSVSPAAFPDALFKIAELLGTECS
jgi:Uma2 family endonuclease